MIEVCIAVVGHGGRFLVRRRAEGSHLAGTWEFPGGKRRHGERGRTCAVRETREESGLEVRAGAEMSRVRHHYPDRSLLLRFFPCTPTGLPGDAPVPAVEGWRWVTALELRRLHTPPANAAVIEGLSGAAPPPRRRPR